VDHYHEERPRQGLGNELIAPQATVIGTGPLQCRERLGGVLKFYDARPRNLGPDFRTRRARSAR
jgi:hypothetical protein